MDSDQFFTFNPSPSSGLRELLAAIEGGMGEMRKRGGPMRVLVDISQLERPPGDVENLILSHHVAQHLRQLERIAVVVKTRTGQGERVARQLDTNMLVFTAADEARQWLNE